MNVNDEDCRYSTASYMLTQYTDLTRRMLCVRSVITDYVLRYLCRNDEKQG